MKRVRGPQKLFKGPTLPGVIQTVSIGEGTGTYLIGRARKFPERSYLAVDPRYGLGMTGYVDPELLTLAGVKVSPKKIVEAMEDLIAKGTRVRHFNFDMPDVRPLKAASAHGAPDLAHANRRYGLNSIFEKAKSLLLPNGTITVRSEHPQLLGLLSSLAKTHGFHVGKRKLENTIAMKERTTFTLHFASRIYKVRFVLHPRKAIPFGRKA